MADRQKRMETLASLYERTGLDWELVVRHSLTEPTCPTAIVRPEGIKGFGRYRADEDTIDAAIDRALELAYRELIEGRVGEPDFPLSSERDAALLRQWGYGKRERCVI